MDIYFFAFLLRVRKHKECPNVFERLSCDPILKYCMNLNLVKVDICLCKVCLRSFLPTVTLNIRIGTTMKTHFNQTKKLICVFTLVLCDSKKML